MNVKHKLPVRSPANYVCRSPPRFVLRRRLRQTLGELLMGSYYLFRCVRCGMSAEVSSGEDRGFFARTQTSCCHGCGGLEDIFIGHTNDLSHPIPEAFSQDGAPVGKCPACGGNNFSPWADGDPLSEMRWSDAQGSAYSPLGLRDHQGRCHGQSHSVTKSWRAHLGNH